MAKAYIGVHPEARHIFVLVSDRADFDKIDLAMFDSGPREKKGHVLTKSLTADGQTIVFQFWVEDPKPLEQRG